MDSSEIGSSHTPIRESWKEEPLRSLANTLEIGILLLASLCLFLPKEIATAQCQIREVRTSLNGREYFVNPDRSLQLPRFLIPQSATTAKVTLSRKISSSDTLFLRSGRLIPWYLRTHDSVTIDIQVDHFETDTLFVGHEAAGIVDGVAVDTIARITESSPRLNEEVRITLGPTRIKPTDVIVTDRLTGSPQSCAECTYDSINKSYSTRAVFSQDVSQYYLRILAIGRPLQFIQFSRNVDSGRYEITPSVELMQKIESIEFEPATIPLITLRPRATSLGIASLGQSGVRVQFEQSIKTIDSARIDKYLKELRETLPIHSEKDESPIAQLESTPGSPDLMLRFNTPTIDPRQFSHAHLTLPGDKGKKAERKVAVRLEIISPPELEPSDNAKTYHPEECVVLMPLADRQVCALFQLCSKGAEIVLQYDTTRSKFVGTISSDIMTGSYPLYWTEKAGNRNPLEANKSNTTITVKEFRVLQQVSAFLLPSLPAGNKPSTAMTYTEEQLRQLKLTVATTSIGLNKGPQFIVVRVSAIDPKGDYSVVQEMKKVAYNNSEARGRDDGPYSRSIESMLPTAGPKPRRATSFSVIPASWKLTKWSVLEVSAAPDSDYYLDVAQNDTNKATLYYRVKGDCLSIRMVIGVPAILGYFGARAEADTLNFAFNPLSATLYLAPIFDGVIVPIGVGIGMLSFNATTEKGGNTHSGVGFSAGVSLDIVGVIRALRWASPPEGARFSFDVSYFLPLGLKSSYSENPIGGAHHRILFGFTTGVEL